MSNVMFNTRQTYPIAQQPPVNVMLDQQQQQQNPFVFEKVLIGLEYAPQSFNVREQIIGSGGANLQYIRNETGALVTLRGRGSLYIDPVLGIESSEPMHLYIEHSHYDGLNSAKQLVNNLIETLQQEIGNLQQVSSQQNNTPVQRSVTYTSRPHIIQQTQTTLSQLNVPPPMLAMPPPSINQQNSVVTQNSIQTAIVQQNVIHQQHSQTQQIVQNPAQNIIHQQFVQHNGVPIQVQSGNMVIQQQIPNLSIPPPSVPIKHDQIVQFQHPPPTILQPQSTTLQTATQQQPGTQIVLNHPQNIQYQYIQQPMQNQRDGQIQGNQVTIHHVYQPQQQIQVQQGGVPQTQIIEQVSHQIRPTHQFQTVQPQQFITIQGNAAYMVPPPTITHQQQPTTHIQHQMVTTNPNIVIQQQQQQLQPIQMQLSTGAIIQNVPQNTQQSQPQQIIATSSSNNPGRIESNYEAIKNDAENNGNKILNQSQGGNDVNDQKEEIKLEYEEESTEKQSNEKSDDFQAEDTNESADQISQIHRTAQTVSSQQQLQQRITINHPPPPQQQHQHLPTSISIPLTHVPPPTISVPPPMGVQHFVGNALISTSTASQIQAATPQQIIHTAANGQNFIMSNPTQWQTRPPPPIQQQICHQIHPIQQLQSNQIQSFQIQHTTPQTEIHHPLSQTVSVATLTAQPPPIYTQTATGHQVAMTINPQVQLQFQPQIIQQIPQPQSNGVETTQVYSSQINSSNPAQINMIQKIQQPLLQPPPPPPLPQMNHQPPPNRRGQMHYPNSLASLQNHQKIQQQQQQQKQYAEHNRGQKRKSNNETDCGPGHHPRLGMGPNDQASSSQGRTDLRFKNIEFTSQPPPAIPSSSTNIGGLNKGQDDMISKLDETPPHMSHQIQHQHPHQQQSMQQFNQEHRLQFLNSQQHGPSSTSGNNQHNPRGVRFYYNSNHNQNYQMRQMSHQNISNEVDNYSHHMNFNGQPPLPPPTGYRGECPPSGNMKGPRYRGQWK